jgi:hypothetical protein
MRTPDPPARTLDEIVRDVVEKLGVDHPIADDSIGIVVDVRSTILSMRTLDGMDGPLWGNRAENQEEIKDLRKRVKSVQSALRQMPDTLRFLLFTPEESGLDDDPVPTTAVQQKAVTRCRRAMAMLALLRSRCDQLAADPPGKHGLVDHRKERAAEEAWDMLQRHMKKPASSGSATSLFRELSSLLFEGATGKPGMDLERACRTVSERRTQKPK